MHDPDGIVAELVADIYQYRRPVRIGIRGVLVVAIGQQPVGARRRYLRHLGRKAGSLPLNGYRQAAHYPIEARAIIRDHREIRIATQSHPVEKR